MDDDHPRDDPELEAYHDMKRELAEYAEEKHRRYIGVDKPVVEHRHEAGRFEESDNEASDPEQAIDEELDNNTSP